MNIFHLLSSCFWYRKIVSEGGNLQKELAKNYFLAQVKATFCCLSVAAVAFIGMEEIPSIFAVFEHTVSTNKIGCSENSDFFCKYAAQSLAGWDRWIDLARG